MDIIESAKNVFEIEIEALKLTKDALGETFKEIIKLIINCSGKIVITGIGKPGHIAKKLAATFSSLGTPSFYIHPAESMHGDLGMISDNDIVIAISYSGESDEIVSILPNIKLIGAKIIAITSNANSTLAKFADITQVLPKFNEACSMGLAPTSSTTVELVYGDALAVVASEIYGFNKVDFGKLHPAGSLGKKLILKVNDIMAKGCNIATVSAEALLMDAITEMSDKCLGIVAIIDTNNNLSGIITDGDLRRIIQKKIDIYSEKVLDHMTKNPRIIKDDKLAIEALQFLKENKINNVPVLDSNSKLVGIITWQMIVRAGIVS